MSTLKGLDKNKLSQKYLDILFWQAKESRNHNHTADMAATYGEILPDSIDKVLSKIQLTEQDVFFDLGSGMGRVTAQFFLNSGVKEAFGIEIIAELHVKALKAAQTILQDLPDFYEGGRKLNFFLGDFLTFSLEKANVVMICAPCFSQHSLAILGKIIENSPNIHTVLTLRPLPTLFRLPFKKTIRIECSWDTALCYVYSKQLL